jgi:arylsulfatase A-like enzyme
MKRISRRDFIKTSVTAGLSLSLPIPFLRPGRAHGGTGAPKVVIISIDALDPRYLYLNGKGEKGGRPGDYLMPNVRALVDSGVFFDNAWCHLPSATDMNHLNALAGTCSRQTGIFGVSAQAVSWGADGKMGVLDPPDLYSWGKSRPIDTIFSAWKREYGEGSRTLFAAGKEWVGLMFDTDGSGVDMVFGGKTRVLDLPGKSGTLTFNAPQPYSFYDPPTDMNASTDYTSPYQKLFCDFFYKQNPENFPSDQWMVENTLAVMDKTRPDLTLLLLAQMDDLQHGLGTAYPEDFNRLVLTKTSSVNAWVCKEAVLDGIRDVDVQVGRFMNGLYNMPEYRDALVVLYSDHGHVTHRDTLRSNVDPFIETDPTAVLKSRRFLTDAEKNGVGYYAYTASSYGGLYFKGPRRAERAAEAKAVLESYTMKDYFPDGSFLGTTPPWLVMTRDDMVKGLPEKGIRPLELYHPFADNPDRGLWPDIILFMNNGWQLPITGGLAANLGISFMASMPPLVGFLGGHGSLDSRRIVMAFTGKGIASGKRVSEKSHVSDIALTIRGYLGMGQDLADRSEDKNVASDRSGVLL